MPLLTLLPVYARNIYHQGVGEYSRLMAFAGVGAITGSLIVASFGRFKRMGVTTLCVQIAFGFLIALFAVTRIIYVSYALLFLTNVALMIVFATVTSLDPAHRAQRDARPRDEHLHAGVPRRDAPRQPGERLSRERVFGAGGPGRERGVVDGRRRVLPAAKP